MPKTDLVYAEQINFLTVRGTQARLRAIAYFRGEGGKFASPARDFIDRGIREFIESLSDKDRKRFDEILQNVEIESKLNHSSAG